ncbi:hypothetical protein ACFVWG_17775 [Kribbella sp. NPDC058245]|uniref:hypothetical protein n=1 Tax=Kribbella sp. NPDC058245 TaxID=3346399 RepID=UPI0036EF7800
MITLLVAFTALWGTWSANHFGADEDREKESRERRATIYADYLGATRNYLFDQMGVAAAEGILDLDKKVAKSPSASENLAAQNRIDVAQHYLADANAKASKSRSEYERQADLVYVYGSDAAWAVQLRIQESLVRKDGKAPQLMVSDDLRDFQAVFCREASATPRDGCGN